MTITQCWCECKRTGLSCAVDLHKSLNISWSSQASKITEPADARDDWTLRVTKTTRCFAHRFLRPAPLHQDTWWHDLLSLRRSPACRILSLEASKSESAACTSLSIVLQPAHRAYPDNDFQIFSLRSIFWQIKSCRW